MDDDDRKKRVTSLIRHHGEALRRYCDHVLEGHAPTDDVLQTVFMQAYRDIDRFAGEPASLGGWLHTIAYHRCLDVLKRERRRPPPPPPGVQSHAGTPPDEAIEVRCLVKELHACLGCLDPEKRTAVLLRNHGYSYAQMERLCGDHAGTIEARVRRSLPVLRECLCAHGVSLDAIRGLWGRLEGARDAAPTELRFVLTNDLEAIRLLTDFLETGLCRTRLRVDEASLVGLALKEALANAILHGNLEMASELLERDPAAYEELARTRAGAASFRRRRVEVEVRETPSEGTYIVTDEGPGFDPAQVPDPLCPENIDKTTGRGLLLIKTYMDEVSHNEKGNRITMVKRWAPGRTALA
jgi:RNA polymerase sigma factor (sigma-70 family)